MERLLTETLAWATGREQGGARLWDHQGVSFPLADSAADAAAGRLLVLEVARLADAGADAKVVHAKASMAKLFVSEAACRCADRAVQAFGGRGYRRDNVAERLPARAARRPHLGGHERDPAADHRALARAPRRREGAPLSAGSAPRLPLLRPRSVAVVGATDRPGSYGDATLRNLGGARVPRAGLGRASDARVGARAPLRAVARRPARAGRRGRGGDPGRRRAGGRARGRPARLRRARRLRGRVRRGGRGGAAGRAAGGGRRRRAARDRAELRRARRLPQPRGAVGRRARAAAGRAASRSSRRAATSRSTRSRSGAGCASTPSPRSATRPWSTPRRCSRRSCEEEDVGSVALFLESDGDGARLTRALARAAERGIGVAVLKVGATAAGATAAAAHTGALAGDQRVFRALVEEAGAAWADDVHDLLELAKALAVPGARVRPRAPAGRGLAILTCSGGDSGLGADEAGRRGLPLPPLSAATAERLEPLLPPAATVANPLDYTAMIWGERERVAGIVRAVAEDPAIDQLLLFYDEPAGDGRRAARELGRRPRRARRRRGRRRRARRSSPRRCPSCCRTTRRPRFLERGVAAGRRAADGARVRRGAAARRRATPPGCARSPAAVAPVAPGDWLAEADAKALLRARGRARCPTAGSSPARTTRSAVARELGGAGRAQGVLAGAAAQERGGRARARRDRATTRCAPRTRACPRPAAARRVLVEAMAAPGVELVVAARRDAVVPALVVGLGGVWTELLGDVGRRAAAGLGRARRGGAAVAARRGPADRRARHAAGRPGRARRARRAGRRRPARRGAHAARAQPGDRAARRRGRRRRRRPPLRAAGRATHDARAARRGAKRPSCSAASASARASAGSESPA